MSDHTVKSAGDRNSGRPKDATAPHFVRRAERLVPSDRSANHAGFVAFARWRNVDVEVVATVGEVALELAESLVLLVAHAGYGHLQRIANLWNGPAPRPHLDDAVLAWSQDGPPRGLENFAELLAIARALIVIGAECVPFVEQLIRFGTLDSLAYEVDGPHELAALLGIVGQDQVQVELACPGLGQQPAADLLCAVVPEAGRDSRIPPTD